MQCPDGNDRLESELAGRLELMGAPIAARGFSAEGVGAEMERIVSLSRTWGRPRSSFRRFIQVGRAALLG